MLNSCCGGADEVSTRSSGSLDHDSVCKILSSLPVKTLMRAKCVCKTWRYLIESDPHFIYLHFTQSKARPSLLISSHVDSVYGTSFSSADLFEVIDHGAVVYKVTATWAENMLKPVNGLICFIRRIELAVLIYNLSTREETPWIETTTTVKKEEMSGYMYPRYGFGFDPATKEHKVLSVFMKKLEYKPKTTTTTVRTTTDHDFCEVLTVGQNTWRRINEVPLPYRVCQDAFYGNGALYWLCGHLDKGSCPLSDSVLVFDVGSEKFIRVILIPNFILDSRSPHWSWVLFEVDGRPALIGTTTRIDRTIKMWMFDHDHDNWIVETISSLPSDEQPKWLFSFEAIEGTDLIIIQSNRKTADPVLSLYYYDRKKKTLTAPPRGGITIKNAPPCGHGGGGELFSISQPLGIPFNYNITYEISSFVESLFPVNQNQQQRLPSSSGV